MNDVTPNHHKTELHHLTGPLSSDMGSSNMGASGTAISNLAGASAHNAQRHALAGLSSPSDAGSVPQNPSAVSVHRRMVECGPLPFLIRRDGSWLYRGSPIGRKEMVCLFASVLRREADGTYWLQTPAERGQIEVEDVPFLAVELDWGGCDRQQKLTFRTNVDEIVTAGPQHRIRVAHDLFTCEPTPYLAVRPGATPEAPWIEARITRAVYYELVALAVPGMVHGRCMLGVWSSGVFFALGEMPNIAGDE